MDASGCVWMRLGAFAAATTSTQEGVVHLEGAEKEQKANRAVKCVFCLTITTTICICVFIAKMTNKF